MVIFPTAEFPVDWVPCVYGLQVFYHLGDLDDALTYALGAGSLFDVSSPSDYCQCMLARCLDTYVAARQSEDESSLDSRLPPLVERLFDRSVRSALGRRVVSLPSRLRTVGRWRDV